MVRFLQTFALLCAAGVMCPAEDFAETLFKAGQKAEKAGDKFHAFLLYARAAALEPSNAEFAMRKAAMQADAAMSARTRQDRAALGLDAGGMDAEPLTDGEMLEARTARMPPRLKGPEGLKSFDLTGDPKAVVEKVMAAYGLMVVFEADYQVPPKFQFRLEDVSFGDALRTLEALSNSFLVPVNERLALMVRDTAQKRTEMMPAMAIAIPVPERISVQDAQEMMTAVAQTLEIRKFSLDPVKRVVYMRDQVSKIAAARTMFLNLSRLRAQVEVDVEFLEVTKSSSLGYGLQLPSSSSIINFSSLLGNSGTSAASASGFTSFLTFGGGATFFGIGIAASAVIATFSKSDSDVILRTQVVALDGQAAELHVGEKYPLVTASYSGGSTSAIGTGQASGLIAPPTINFVDLGLVLKITPSVHEGGEVTLDISSEFKVLGSADANGNPSISDRKYTGKVRLKNDESAVVAGLLNTVDGDTINGIAGVSSIPWIGRLLRSNAINRSTDEVLLVLRPHLVAQGPWEDPTKPIWVGTESKPLTFF
ncbi:MAG: type II and III secretion system protein [Bryobacteraceae bacterium]